MLPANTIDAADDRKHGQGENEEREWDEKQQGEKWEPVWHMARNRAQHGGAGNPDGSQHEAKGFYSYSISETFSGMGKEEILRILEGCKDIVREL